MIQRCWTLTKQSGLQVPRGAAALIRQDLSKSQVFCLALCRATAPHAVVWALSPWSLPPPTSLPSSLRVPLSFASSRTSAWDLKRKVALHHTEKLLASPKSHLQVVASKVPSHPACFLVIHPPSYGPPKQEVNPEMNLNSPPGTGNNNPPSTHPALIALDFALTAEKWVLHHLPVPAVSEGEGILPAQWTGLWGLPL